MTRGYYEDEDGVGLWSAPDAEHVPPGSLVTGPDGQRYFAVRVQSVQLLDGSVEQLRVTLRPVRDGPG